MSRRIVLRPTPALGRDGFHVLLLVFLSAYFCHRIYGVNFRAEGFAPLALYYRLNEALIGADYNPFHWYYFSWLPSTGVWSLPVQAVGMLVRVFFFAASELTRAFATNALTSVLCLALLSTGAYAWLRAQVLTPLASLLGAIILSFTGFHLVGVYEFDLRYLISLMVVVPVLYCFQRLMLAPHPRRWAGLAALLIGLSVLSGSHTPLFYYLPFFLLLPLLPLLGTPEDWPYAVRALGWQVGSIAGGLLIAGAALLPDIVYSRDTLRSVVSFSSGIESLTIPEKILSLLLRDWGRLGGWQFHEVDYFLGLPVVILLFYGLWVTFFARDPRRPLQTLDLLLAICLGASLILSHLSHLPTWIATPVGFFFEGMRIRHPNHLFSLALLPAAYFCARGLERFHGLLALLGTLVGVLLNIALFYWVVLPNFNAMLSDVRLSAILSLGCAFLACGFMGSRAVAKIRRGAPDFRTDSTYAIVFLIFGMYLFAPAQLTRYPSGYLVSSEKLATLPADRLSFTRVLGLTSQYGAAVESIRPLLLETPRHLEDSRLLQGRVLDTRDATGGRLNYFAPHSGHQFSYTALSDLSSPHRIYTLASIGNPALLDVGNVCWILSETGIRTAVPEARRTCFPMAYFVPGAHFENSEKNVLNWLTTAGRADLANNIVVNCSEVRCEGLPTEYRGPARNFRPVRITREANDRFVMNFDAPQSGFVFISIPYRFDWQAEVGDKRETVIPANYAYSAIPVESGTKHVTISLSHSIRKLGASISLISFLIALAAAGWPVPEEEAARAHRRKR